MIQVTASTAGGKELRLQSPQKLQYLREYGVPADSLAVSFPGELPEPLQTVRVTLHGSLLLDGVVDEQVLERTHLGTRTVLYARSLAALLLDSECKPMTMQNPSTRDVFCVTAEPMGFENHLPVAVYRGQYQVEKGACLWSALADYVGTASGAAVLLRGRALCAFALREDTPHRLKGDAGLLSLRQTLRPCAGVSEVRYKTRPQEDYPWTKLGAGTSGAVRYLNLSEVPPWLWERRLERSLRTSGAAYGAAITLAGCRVGELGDRVLPAMRLAWREPLYLSAVTLRLGRAGWQTEWRLNGAQFFKEW